MFRKSVAGTAPSMGNFAVAVPGLQIGLALSAVLSGGMAVRHGLMMQATDASLCLGTPKISWLASTGHCPWCYAALALMALAAWPVRLGLRPTNGSPTGV
jgi:hypothetical protein